MRISCVRVHLGKLPTLNSCALSHWLPPATSDIDSTLLAFLYARFMRYVHLPNLAVYSSTSGVKTHHVEYV